MESKDIKLKLYDLGVLLKLIHFQVSSNNLPAGFVILTKLQDGVEELRHEVSKTIAEVPLKVATGE